MPQIKSIQRRPPGQRVMVDRRARRGRRLAVPTAAVRRETERLFQALGDGSRRAIVEYLGREGAASVSRVARQLQISVPAVAQHLKVLEWSGLVRTAKFGRARSCRLDPEGFRPIERWIRDCRSGWNQRFERYSRPSSAATSG